MAVAASPLPPLPSRPDGSRLLASPLARRLADRAGLDLAHLTGSGPRGRIVRRDVEAAEAAGARAGRGRGAVDGSAANAAPVVAAPTLAPAAAPTVDSPAPVAPVAPVRAPHTALPHSTMRKVIARRLTESKQTVPHFYLTIDCRIDALLDLRARLNAQLADQGQGIKLSVNDMIIKAAALALRRVPAANASWTEEAILRWQDVDIAVAVATPTGLITPIVRKADQMGLATIAATMRDLAARAREGRLTPEEYQGGGFSISNLGMYGISSFSAIINPPQGCILAVGAGEPRPVVTDGALAVATVMTCTLSVDHRVVDGAVGAEFLAAFKALIEQPLAMLL